MIIAHYRMDGDATDSIGDNDGSVNGGVTWVDGRLGQAANFNGSSEYISQPSISDYLHNRPEASIAMWVKKDSIQYGFFQLSGYVSSNGNLYPYQTKTKVYLDTFRTNRLGPIYMPTSVLEWHHFVVTQKPGEWKLYQNGELVHTAGANDYISTDYLQFEIGRNSSSRYANGQFDDVRIYDHALSPREVRDLSLGLARRYSFEGDDLLDYAGGKIVHPSAPVPSIVGAGPSGLPAYLFDGSTQYLDTGDTIPFIRGDAAFSLTAWVWLDSNQGSTTSGGSIIGHADSTGFGMQVHGRQINFGYRSTSNFTGGTRLDLGRWYHVSCVREKGGNCYIYLNGNLDGSDTNVLHVNSTTEPVQIGYSAGRMGYLHGRLSDIRIYTTALTAAHAKELYQQRASLDSEGSVHTPAIQQNPRARYIRDWTNGSTSNGGDHWLEVRAIYAGENISLGKPVTASASATRLSKVTDGTTGNSGYAKLSSSAPVWVQVDLEEVREIDEVQVWHYNADGRTYYDTKTEISEDGINWTTIFDSAVSGTYKETSAGVTHQAKALGPVGATPRGLRVPDTSEVGVTRGLVAWYPLIGDTLDYAGTNHAVNNGAVATAEGYEFDGTSNAIPEDNLTVGGSPGFSVSTVIRVDSFISDFQMSVHLNEVNMQVGDSALWGGVSSGNFLTMTLGAKDASGWAAGETSITPEVGRLYHVCASWDGETTTVYVDGKAEVSYPLAAISEQTGVFRIGGHDGGYRGFNGIIRDVRIHNVALTPEEVAIQYQLALNEQTKTMMTADCLYTTGQFKEVIS